jgi:hypothetical protein
MVSIIAGLNPFAMIQFSNPSEEFKRKNPHIFEIEKQIVDDILLEAKASKIELNSERELQGQIVNLLRLKGIEVLWHRTDKKSAATVGWPDLTFSLEHGLRSIPCLWEIKLPGKKLSEDQTKLMIRLMEPPNAWVYKVITSVEEALMELRKLGIQ